MTFTLQRGNKKVWERGKLQKPIMKQKTMSQTYHINGRIIDRNSGRGAAGLWVEAWDREFVFNEPLGSMVSDEQGLFHFEFTESYFEKYFSDQWPEIFFRVYKQAELIQSTEESVLWNVDIGESKRVVIEVEVPFIVKGQIRYADGSRLIGSLLVRAFDKDLRHEQWLGEQYTNAEGYYKITYTRAQFHRAEKKSANLIIRVFNKYEKEPLIASGITFHAKPLKTINLTLEAQEYQGLSEYEQFIAELAPLLEDIDQPTLIEKLADLKEDENHQEITFLASETGLNAEYITFLVQAAKLHQKTDLYPEVFYGFFRQNLPTDLPSLLIRSSQELRIALETALRNHIIPTRFREELEQILQQLPALIVQQAIEPSTQEGKHSLSELLGTSIDNQTEFLTAYVNHSGSIEEFWQGMRESPDFQNDVDSLQFTLQVGALTNNHLPLVQEIQGMQRNGKLTSLQDLARFDVAEWWQRIDTIGFPPDIPGDDDEEKANNYATIMAQKIEDVFPTAFTFHRIEQEENIEGKSDLLTFFAQSETKAEKFDLGTTYLEYYLAQNEEVLAGVADPERLKNQIKGMQRLYKLAPRYAERRVLLADGLDSAHNITRMGQTTFMLKYSELLGGPGPANALSEKAAQISGTALNLYAEYGTMFNQIGLHVLPSLASQPKMANIPDWETLFGSLALCTCKHCRSVYSPAAYLVDILYFLSGRKLFEMNEDGNKIVKWLNRTAKHVLFARRPDIGEIELSCENTNTPVPYVDLVNEVLENAIAPTMAPHSLQTCGTVEELAANPQYINSGAYDKLRKAVFPWQMPFDLWAEEARAYLGHLGVQHHELMRAFLKIPDSFDLTDPNIVAIASEHLGLTSFERQIITNSLPSVRKYWEYWGYTTGNSGWINELKKVRVFLDKSGLNYQALLDLLKTKFVNPDKNITISSKDNSDPTTCDTIKFVINNLDEKVLNRIHRFVRLWRKLGGWTMRELDQAITAFTTTIDDTFIVRLSHIQTLRANLNLSVEQVLALWTNINTDGEDALYRRLFQNPTVLKPVDTHFKLENNELKIFTNSPTNARPNISDKKYQPTILAALSITETDLAAMVKTTDDKLNLANFSKLYHTTILAKAQKLSVKDTLTLKALTQINPFDIAKTEDTLRFVEAINKVRASGFTIAELDYLLRHQFVAISGIAPTEESIALILDEIRNGLQKIAEEDSITTKSLIIQKLGEALNLEIKITEQLLTRWVNSPEYLTQKAITAFLEPAFVESHLNVKLTAKTFPDQFKTFTRLHKIATVIDRFKITSKQLPQVFQYAQDGSLAWLNLNSLLPVVSTDSSSEKFVAWEKLVELFQPQDALLADKMLKRLGVSDEQCRA